MAQFPITHSKETPSGRTANVRSGVEVGTGLGAVGIAASRMGDTAMNVSDKMRYEDEKLANEIQQAQDASALSTIDRQLSENWNAEHESLLNNEPDTFETLHQKAKQDRSKIIASAPNERVRALAQRNADNLEPQLDSKVKGYYREKVAKQIEDTLELNVAQAVADLDYKRASLAVGRAIGTNGISKEKAEYILLHARTNIDKGIHENTVSQVETNMQMLYDKTHNEEDMVAYADQEFQAGRISAEDRRILGNRAKEFANDRGIKQKEVKDATIDTIVDAMNESSDLSYEQRQAIGKSLKTLAQGKITGEAYDSWVGPEGKIDKWIAGPKQIENPEDAEKVVDLMNRVTDVNTVTPDPMLLNDLNEAYANATSVKTKKNIATQRERYKTKLEGIKKGIDNANDATIREETNSFSADLAILGDDYKPYIPDLKILYSNYLQRMADKPEYRDNPDKLFELAEKTKVLYSQMVVAGDEKRTNMNLSATRARIANMKEPPKEVKAYNNKTGERIISHDGGKTWQLVK